MWSVRRGKTLRILFVGNGDIAGKYIANRLYKEGHKIYLLTENEQDIPWDEYVKGHIYKSSLTSNRCKNVFKGNSIDIVIFMTGEFRDKWGENIGYSYQSMIPNLTNILRISCECKVKQFIFLSSTELDTFEHLPPILTDLKSGELLCESFSRYYNLPLLILRMSNVYGIGKFDKLGFTGNMMRKMLNGENLRLLIHEESSVDLIYGEDLADAVFRGIMEHKLGEYHVCSGKSISFRTYMECITKVCDYKEKLYYTNEEPKKLINVDMSDNRFKEELGWVPMHDFLENGQEVLKAAMKENIVLQEKNEEKHSTESSHINASKLKNMIRALVENFILFTIASLLLRYTSNSASFRFVDVRLVYVAVISSIYGLKQGLIATILACISYGYSIARSGVDLTYLVYSIETWTPYIMYLIVGATVGYASDKKTDDKQIIKDENQILSEKYDFLKEIYLDVCDVKNQLQRQILISKDSFGRVYDIAKELDTFKPELIFFKTVNILEDIIECNEVSIYTVNPDHLTYIRLMANSVSLAGTLSGSLNLDDLPALQQSIEKKEFFVNKNLLENYPAYAAPIIDNDKVIALVMVHHVDFTKFTIFYQNLIQIVIGMVQNNLVKALVYNKDSYKKRYFENTEIFKPEEFLEHLKIMESAKEKIKLFYLVMRVRLKDHQQLDRIEFSNRIITMLRSTDFMGSDKYGNYYIVFMQTDKNYIELLTNRFMNAGFILEDGGNLYE